MTVLARARRSRDHQTASQGAASWIRGTDAMLVSVVIRTALVALLAAVVASGASIIAVATTGTLAIIAALGSWGE